MLLCSRLLVCRVPSGAGKTTLLNALGGRATYGEVSGAVTLGGRPLTSEDLNYVPQFDEHSERFTPREILTYMKHLQVRYFCRLIYYLDLGKRAEKSACLDGLSPRRVAALLRLYICYSSSCVLYLAAVPSIYPL